MRAGFQMLCPQLPNKLSVFKYFMVVLLGFWLFYSCLSPEQEEGERCWKMTNAKITSIYIYFFFFPIFWTELLQIKVQVIAQCVRFVIFHPCIPEDDGTNMKHCQLLYGHYLDLWKCAQCFPSVKSQKKPPWGTMWCCLLWPRITKMKGLSEHRLFKTIQVFLRVHVKKEMWCLQGHSEPWLVYSSLCLCVQTEFPK